MIGGIRPLLLRTLFPLQLMGPPTSTKEVTKVCLWTDQEKPHLLLLWGLVETEAWLVRGLFPHLEGKGWPA